MKHYMFCCYCYCCSGAKLCLTLSQLPLSMRFPRQEYWRGLPFPSPGDLPDPVIEPAFPTSAGGFFTVDPPGKPKNTSILN